MLFLRNFNCVRTHNSFFIAIFAAIKQKTASEFFPFQGNQKRLFNHVVTNHDRENQNQRHRRAFRRFGGHC